MDKYEISLWEDYYDDSPYPKERKIAVIGSDTMRAHGVQARAIEPNLVTDVNGTTTLTFKMYYNYTDSMTGETYRNPFSQYLVNERKVKVFWKDKWYDLVIKKSQEDSSKKLVIYTCTDIFINELSKNGYSLEFDTELQNNIGTAAELARAVLEGSTWQYNEELSEPILQKTEGPVYKVTIINPLTLSKQNPNAEETIRVSSSTIFVFYDSIVDILDTGGTVDTQFWYDPAQDYKRDINDSLIITGDCYHAPITWAKVNNTLVSDSIIIDLNKGVSTEYRAKRIINNYITEYDSLLKRYVTICDDINDSSKTVCEVATTEYSNPLLIINLVANPYNFTNVAGWLGAVGEWMVYPPFDETTDITTYTTKSYLKINSNDYIYNTGIQSNVSYFQPTDVEIQKGTIGGIQVGEKYVFRVRGIIFNNNVMLPFDNALSILVSRFEYVDDKYTPIVNTNIFSVIQRSKKDGWIEYTLQCNTTVTASNIEQYGLFIKSNTEFWLEEAQFFKYSEGTVGYGQYENTQRINPGDISLQSYATPVYRYYYQDKTLTDVKDLEYIYTGSQRPSRFVPRLSNYEKVGTINASASNRFNILQTIAETFKAWVRFQIEHDENGAVKFSDNGIPQKFVYFVPEVGQETGIVFEYGIDLKTISRVTNSDTLATKILILPNANEFAQNGFCTIARSPQNYTGENFIINLDYYTQQNLLDNEQLSKDLYSTDSSAIGYYYLLHTKNNEYDEITNTLVVKRADLQHLAAEKTVYEQYILAANQQLEQIESDLTQLSGVLLEDISQYIESHSSNTQVQSLLNSYGQVQNQITEYNTTLANINSSYNTLDSYINDSIEKQKTLIEEIKAVHQKFTNKYGTYLLEGTWQDENYVDDTKYYLDALNVAYTSSRPQLSYTINVLRLSCLEEFSSKVFQLGDICHIQDREFFGYLSDGFTPYKEKILVNKLSSFFDQPEKDVITVQNYKTQFDDLFQRIAATTQSISYAEGTYARVVNMVNSDNTLDFSVLQDTITQNEDLVINSSNQDVIWDSTGITVTNKTNTADRTKIMAGGIFITNDGGVSWKNAIRGDGISTDVLTAGRINTGEIYLYSDDAPSFRWDNTGITAYSTTSSGIDFGSFVRHDKYGLYGCSNSSGADFIPTSLDDIENNATFGLTWDRFFLKSDDEIVFKVDADGAQIAGWEINKNSLSKTNEEDTLALYSTPSSVRIGDNDVECYMVAGSNFFLATDGTLYANNVHMTGEIIQDISYAGNIVLDNEGIIQTINNKSVGFYSDGREMTILNKALNCYLVAGDNFGVTLDGGLYCSLGQIAGWVITEDDLYGGNPTITPPSSATFPYDRPELYGNYLGLNRNGTIYGYYRTPTAAVGSNVVERYTRWYIGPDPNRLSIIPIEIGSVPSDWGWPSDMNSWEWSSSSDFRIISEYYDVNINVT